MTVEHMFYNMKVIRAVNKSLESDKNKLEYEETN